MRGFRSLSIALCSGTLLLSACSGSSLRFQGKPVHDPDKVLATIQERWSADLARQSVTRHREARCYYSRNTGSDSIEASVFCGPVRHFAADGGAGSGPWDTYGIQINSAAGESAEGQPLVLGADAPRFGVDLPPNATLARPDGLNPPPDADKLAAPPPPPVESGFTAVVKETRLNDAPTPSPDNFLVSPRETLTVSKVGKAEQVATTSGIRSPAKGEIFFVAKLDLSDGPFSGTYESMNPDYLKDTETRALVRSGSSNREIQNVDDMGVDGKVLAVSASPSSDPLLVLGGLGPEQSLSLATGKRISKSASAFYLPKASVKLSKAYDGPYSPVGDFEVKHSRDFYGAMLSPFHPGLGWSPSKMSYLIIHTKEVSSDWTSGYNCELDPSKSSVLTDKDGKSYRDLMDSESAMTSATGIHDLVFEVPEGERNFKLTFTPTFNFEIAATWMNAKPTSGSASTKPMKLQLDFN